MHSVSVLLVVFRWPFAGISHDHYRSFGARHLQPLLPQRVANLDLVPALHVLTAGMFRHSAAIPDTPVLSLLVMSIIPDKFRGQAFRTILANAHSAESPVRHQEYLSQSSKVECVRRRCSKVRKSSDSPTDLLGQIAWEVMVKRGKSADVGVVQIRRVTTSPT